MTQTQTVISRDGTSLACWQTGAGAPLLLVHGGLCDHLSWYFVVPLLAQHFAVWTYDRRGRGQSGDARPHSPEREGEDIEAILAAIAAPAHLLGHSAGGIAALHAALRVPNLLSLMLYEPPYIATGARAKPGPAILQEMERRLAADDPDAALAIAMRETVDMSDAEIDSLRSSPGWEHLRAAARAIPYDWALWDDQPSPEALAAISAPALALMGSNSPAWLQSATRAVAAALPHAQLVSMEGEGHSAMITAPERFAAEVVRFASAHGRTGS
ncbi:MAG TPA: alpha/beta hydrolase [Acidobacteriaceae bacterium]|jgi:pimeloyl-ACP methyl ester carboxylesterase|nr:alpha/beta hydrolase [Acidobacteriaceae bacterium]